MVFILIAKIYTPACNSRLRFQGTVICSGYSSRWDISAPNPRPIFKNWIIENLQKKVWKKCTEKKNRPIYFFSVLSTKTSNTFLTYIFFAFLYNIGYVEKLGVEFYTGQVSRMTPADQGPVFTTPVAMFTVVLGQLTLQLWVVPGSGDPMMRGVVSRMKLAAGEPAYWTSRYNPTR